MGLPIWRDPEEKVVAKNALKNDPTAASRSRIRRPSMTPNLPAHLLPAQLRFERVARDRALAARNTPPFPGPSEPRRNGRADVPPLLTLLESADRSAPRPPPPAPESHIYYNVGERNMVPRYERAAAVSGPPVSQVPDGVAYGNETGTPRHLRALPVERNARLSALSLSGPGGNNRHAPSISRPHLLRSPDSHHAPRRERSGAPASRRNTLPTPPLDQSEQDSESLFFPEMRSGVRRRRENRGSHPLADARPYDRADGRRGRDRSASPATNPTDEWETMRTTIAADETLPSADSSFATAAASRSFNSSNDGNTTTEPEVISPLDGSRRSSSDYDSQSDSASSLDVSNFCPEEDEALMIATETIARDLYYREMETPEGRQRIAAQHHIRDHEGNRFALANEPASVDIGLRLIEAALESDEGRRRVLGMGSLMDPDEEYRQLSRIVRVREQSRRRRQLTSSPDYPEQEPSSAVSPTSPPIESVPRPFPIQQETEISRDAPEAHPVSPPDPRLRREGSGLLSDLQDGEHDLGAMMRIVERLASRDDVPDEWWMSMGLNLPRPPPRRSSPDEGADAVFGSRPMADVRSSWIERPRGNETDRVSRL